MYRRSLCSPLILSSILFLLLTACQPIRPEAASPTVDCTDTDQLVVVQQYMASYAQRDPETAINSFMPDGVMAVEVAPYLDRATGEYKSPFTAVFTGTEELSGIIYAFVDYFALGSEFITGTVQGDTVIATGIVSSPENYALGMPTTALTSTFTFQIEGCKIARMDHAYTPEAMAALPAAAEAAASECSDEYKIGRFRQYADGVSDGNTAIAALPWAEHALAEYDAAPVLDEATQQYILDPALRNAFQGSEDIEWVIGFFIENSFYKALQLDTAQITGQTLELDAVISTPMFAEDPFLLPLTELASHYSVDFNSQCQIEHLRFFFTDQALTDLNAAKSAE